MRNPKRILGYARVSSAEQALGTSLTDQQDVIRGYAEKRGLKVTKIYVEAESAIHEKAERREQVQALLRDARAGDLVLVDKIDRWSRDPEFTYRTIRELLARDARFYAIGDDCDPSTPAGDTALGFRVLFAREEHKRIKVRMVGTRRILRDRGFYVDGLPPLGYRRQDVKGVERNALVIDESRAAIVRDVFARCIAGQPLRVIEEAVGIERTLVAKMLKTRTYLGEVRDTKGVWIAGKHAAIIDRHVFDAADAALTARRHGDRRGREGSETTDWWLRDLARCGLCGGKLAAAYAGPQDARRYYFRCWHRCTPTFVPVRAAETACDPLVVARLVELRRELATTKRVEPPRASVDVEARRKKLDAKRARLVDGFTEGLISREELLAQTAKLDAERSRLEAFEPALPAISREDRRAALLGVDAIATAWRLMTPIEKRSAINTLARAVRLSAERVPGLGSDGRNTLIASVNPPAIDWYSAEDLARGGSFT